MHGGGLPPSLPGESGGTGRRAGLRSRWGINPRGSSNLPFRTINQAVDMEIDIENPGGLARTLRIRLPAERLQKEKQARLKRLARSRQMPGFRRGHAPQALIEREYGAAAEDGALRRVISDGLSEALKEEALRPADLPQIVDSRRGADGSVEFTAQLEVLPEIELAPLDSITVEQAACEVSAADLDRGMELLLQRYTQYTPVQRCATLEDWVEAREVRDERAAGAEQEAEVLRFDLASATLAPEFRNALVNALPGDQVTVRPPGQPDAEAQAIKLEVVQVLRADRPALDEDFVTGLGIAGVSSPEQLRERLGTDLGQRGELLAARHTHNKVLQTLHEAHRQKLTEVPECLVQQKLQGMHPPAADNEAISAQIAQALQQYARQSVQLELLLSAWVRHLELKPEAARARRFLERAVAESPDPKAARKSLRANPSLKARFESMALEEQLVEKVLAGARVERKTYTYTQLHQAFAGRQERASPTGRSSDEGLENSTLGK